MMADNYKILAQDTVKSVEENSGQNQANILYTVPENTQVAISSISLVNTAEENVEYSLGIVKAEDVNTSVEEVSYIIDGGPKLYIALDSNYQFSTHLSNFKYSTDAINWTQSTMPGSSYFSIVYGDDKFVAVGGKFDYSSTWPNYNSAGVAYSTNGTTWIEGSAIPTVDAENYWFSVTYGGGKFVVVGRGSIAAHSTNGVTWTLSGLPVNNEWRSVTYGDEKFVAVGDNTFSVYSTDGISWWQGSLPGQNYGYDGWKSVAYGNGIFVAVTAHNSYTAARSSDGIAWTEFQMPAFYNPFYTTRYYSIVHGDGKFVAIANNRAAVSTDGIFWSSTSLSPRSWTSVTYGNGKFVAVAGYSDISIYSTDGITWTETATDSGPYWGSVTYGETLQEIETSITVLSNTQTIIPTRSIEPNAVDEIVGGITLSAGDQIRIYSESPDLIAQVYGVEIA
jgi:hypothetical protein